jgi:hypothetical protein
MYSQKKPETSPETYQIFDKISEIWEISIFILSQVPHLVTVTEKSEL